MPIAPGPTLRRRARRACAVALGVTLLLAPVSDPVLAQSGELRRGPASGEQRDDGATAADVDARRDSHEELVRAEADLAQRRAEEIEAQAEEIDARAQVSRAEGRLRAYAAEAKRAGEDGEDGDGIRNGRDVDPRNADVPVPDGAGDEDGDGQPNAGDLLGQPLQPA